MQARLHPLNNAACNGYHKSQDMTMPGGTLSAAGKCSHSADLLRRWVSASADHHSPGRAVQGQAQASECVLPIKLTARHLHSCKRERDRLSPRESILLPHPSPALSNNRSSRRLTKPGTGFKALAVWSRLFSIASAIEFCKRLRKRGNNPDRKSPFDAQTQEQD